MIRYNVIDADDALQYLTARREDDDSIRLEDIRRTEGNGPEMPAEPIKKLQTKLLKLKKDFPDKLKKRDPEGGRFESEACVIVHQCLSDVDRQVLCDHGFWRYLALDPFAEIVEWRFGSNGKPAQPANYGIGNRIENMLFRLWLRADLGKSSGADPYELARAGDQDLWRSHLLRQDYSNARHIAKSLLKLQDGRLKQGKKVAQKLAGGDHPEGIRLLAKRLKRIRANVVFEYLTPQQADALVIELSSDLKKD